MPHTLPLLVGDANGRGARGMSAMCDEDRTTELLALLREQREALERMRDDVRALSASLDAIRRESAAHDTATRRQLGQVTSTLDRNR
jgi:uncharacterized coiled-coil protein SlyX